MSGHAHAREHAHEPAEPNPAQHAEAARPRRSDAPARAGTPSHGGPHAAGSFHDAINAGLHAMVLGRVTLRGGPLGPRASEQLLVARRELSPAAGLPDRAAATALAAAHPGTLLAIARMPDGKFRVFDTGFTAPHPGPTGTEPRVEVAPISRSGMYDVVGWANLDLTPRDRGPDLAEPALLGTGQDRFAQFEHANAGLGRERLTQIRLALEQVLGGDVELRDAFYDNYTRHTLGVASGDELRDMERRDWEAKTTEAGNTVVLPSVLGYPPVRLVSLLLHEMMHGRNDHPGSNPITGNPVQEGEAYAIQYFVVERANGPQEERDRILQIVTTGGGEVLGSLVPVELDAFNRTYAALVALQQIIDGRFVHRDAPFAQITPAHAGDLMRELATEATHSAELAQVLAWTADNRSRFALPRR